MAICAFTAPTSSGDDAKSLLSESEWVQKRHSAGGCAEVDAAEAQFRKTLKASPGHPPMSDPQESPGAARKLKEAIATCLTRRRVSFEESGGQIEIVPGRSTELNRLAAELRERGIRLIHSSEALLMRPYAQAAFDADARVLHFPVDAVAAGSSLSLAHELIHVDEHFRHRRDGASVRNLVVRHPDIRPDDLQLDEVVAYKYSAGLPIAESMQQRTQAQQAANGYIEFARSAVVLAGAEFSIAGSNEWCSPLTPEALASVFEFLQCAETASVHDVSVECHRSLGDNLCDE